MMNNYKVKLEIEASPPQIVEWTFKAKDLEQFKTQILKRWGNVEFSSSHKHKRNNTRKHFKSKIYEGDTLESLIRSINSSFDLGVYMNVSVI